MRCRYRAIFFDLDGTLIEERAGVAESRAAVAAALWERGHAIDDAAYSHAASAVIDEVLSANEGSWPPVFSRLDAIRATLERLSLPTEDVAELSALHHRTRLEYVSLLAGARAAVEQARAGHQVGLITNGPGEEQRQKLARTGLEAHFESVTVSGEIGVAKPDRGIFETALASLGVGAEEAVFVGNNFQADVVGARGAGLDAVWLRSPGVPAPADANAEACMVIESMLELGTALGWAPWEGATGRARDD